MSVRARPLSRLIVVRSCSRSGVGVMIRTASISIFSPPFLSPRVTVHLGRAFLQTGLESGQHHLDFARQRLAIEVARRAPGEGRYAVVDDAAPHFREIAQDRADCRCHLLAFVIGKQAASTSKRSVLNSASMSRRTASRRTSGETTMPRLSSSARWRALQGQPLQAPLLLGRQVGVGVDEPRTAAEQRIETLGAQFVTQRLTQSVDLRAQARQIVDEAIPKRRLDRLAFGALGPTWFHGSLRLSGLTCRWRHPCRWYDRRHT